MASFAQFGNDLHTGKRSFDIVGRRKLWYLIAGAMILIAILGPTLRGGFVFGIEFTGGSEFVVSDVATQNQQTATKAVSSVVPAAVPKVSTVSSSGIRVQTDQLTPEESDSVRKALADAYGVPVTQVTSSFIGPSWGADITGQALRGLIIFLFLAAIVMALYFRTWKMSAAAMVALLHDLVITAGFYGITGFEITPAAVIGFLTILGYSLYDTVVVFDKIRENTSEDGSESRRTFADSVNLAVNQTLVRSINTSIVAALPVACGDPARHRAGPADRHPGRHIFDDLHRLPAVRPAALQRAGHQEARQEGARPAGQSRRVLEAVGGSLDLNRSPDASAQGETMVGADGGSLRRPVTPLPPGSAIIGLESEVTR
jgi:preprotein translocase subunit SecF